MLVPSNIKKEKEEEGGGEKNETEIEKPQGPSCKVLNSLLQQQQQQWRQQQQQQQQAAALPSNLRICVNRNCTIYTCSQNPKAKQHQQRLKSMK